MPHRAANNADRMFRIGATALAAGVPALWGVAAQASLTLGPDLVTQTYDVLLSGAPTTVQVGTGAPFGSPQFNFFSYGVMPIGTAGVMGNLKPCTGVACDPPLGPNGLAAALTPGEVVGPGSSFLTSSDVIGSFLPGFPKSSFSGYIGLQFDIDGAPDPYGFALLRTTGVDEELVSITYDANGGPVTVPAVPEPASLSLLALGAAGVLALRRRRASASA